MLEMRRTVSKIKKKKKTKHWRYWWINCETIDNAPFARIHSIHTHTHANTHRAKSDKYWTLLSCDSWVFKKSGLAKKKNPKTHCRNELLSLRNSVDFLQWLSMLSLHGFSCVLKWVAMIFIALDILIHCGWCLWVSDLFYFACHLKQFFRLFGGFFSLLFLSSSRGWHIQCVYVCLCVCVCVSFYIPLF